jgi:hypothetical protein
MNFFSRICPDWKRSFVSAEKYISVGDNTEAKLNNSLEVQFQVGPSGIWFQIGHKSDLA